jgi:hypothetical protein
MGRWRPAVAPISLKNLLHCAGFARNELAVEGLRAASGIGRRSRFSNSKFNTGFSGYVLAFVTNTLYD